MIHVQICGHCLRRAVGAERPRATRPARRLPQRSQRPPAAPHGAALVQFHRPVIVRDPRTSSGSPSPRTVPSPHPILSPTSTPPSGRARANTSGPPSSRNCKRRERPLARRHLPVPAHAERPNETVVIAPTVNGREWSYYVSLPDTLQNHPPGLRRRRACCSWKSPSRPDQSAEIPAMARRGVTKELVCGHPHNLVLELQPAGPNGTRSRGMIFYETNALPLKSAHAVLSPAAAHPCGSRLARIRFEGSEPIAPPRPVSSI